MLDKDLAELYEVPTGRLNERVKRNIDRFPEDFMFQINKEEYASLRSQFAILKRGRHTKYLPYAFTEHGVLMLSNVLKSERAVEVSIQIVRVFSKMRGLISSYKNLEKKIVSLEKKHLKHDEDIKIVFETIKKLLIPEIKKPRRKIGFRMKKTSQKIS